MFDLTRTQQEIITYIIAENEGVRPFGKITAYMQAFHGGFSPAMPFTFYFLSETRPIMYVYDPRSSEDRSTREAFHRECHQKKPKMLEITGFFEYLTGHNYIRRICRGLWGRPELPEGYAHVWRKYSDFYNDLMSGLSFVCLADFTPKLKLYKLWKNRTPLHLP
ncbi:MAG: hypothetical protein LBP88_08465 [Treponema sp.]|jgi:hypothetical protein|nr:hypothetical protein [Treponema sp.]